MSRHQDLVGLVADDFAEMRSPLSGAFLSEHEVTADECFELCDTIAGALQAWSVLPGPVRAALVLWYGDPEIGETMLLQILADRVHDRLRSR